MYNLEKYAKLFIKKLAESSDEKLQKVTNDINTNIHKQLTNAGQKIKYSITFGWSQISPSHPNIPYIKMKFSIMEIDKQDYSEEIKQFNMVVVQTRKMHKMHAKDDLKLLVIQVINLDIPEVESVTIQN